MFSGQPVYPRTRVLHATYCKLPDLPRVDRDRCRLGVDDGIQECHVRVVGQRVEGDAVDRRQGERVEASQVKEPVAADHAVVGSDVRFIVVEDSCQTNPRWNNPRTLS